MFCVGRVCSNSSEAFGTNSWERHSDEQIGKRRPSEFQMFLTLNSYGVASGKSGGLSLDQLSDTKSEGACGICVDLKECDEKKELGVRIAQDGLIGSISHSATRKVWARFSGNSFHFTVKIRWKIAPDDFHLFQYHSVASAAEGFADWTGGDGFRPSGGSIRQRKI